MRYTARMRRFLACLLVVTGAVLWYRHALGPVDAESAAERAVTIAEGMSVGNIAELLEEEGIIRSSVAFHVFVRLRGAGKNLQAGHFVLNPAMSTADVVEILRTGKAREIAVTIPEGFSLSDIDVLLAQRGIAEREAILDCARHCDFSSFGFLPVGSARNRRPLDSARGLAPYGGVLEGYLFPETYYVEPANFVPKFFLERLLGEFRHRVVDGLAQDFHGSKRSLHDIVTMASLIEKEAKTDDERPVIAGVLWKRLDANAGLDVDATIRYAVGKKAEPLTAEDLRVDSPYNTRRERGLPPGPIANPGMASIRAALHPQATEYWYYLHGRDGKVRYAVTNDEHNLNRAKYLR